MKISAKQKVALKGAGLFFLLSVVFSSLLSYIAVQFNLSQPVVVLLYSFGVVLSVLSLRGMAHVPLGNLLNVTHLYLLAIVLPLTYVGALFMSTQDLAIFSVDVMYLLASAALFVLISSFFEEVGWRGHLFSTLKPFGWVSKNIIIGLMWALWHFPAILSGSYNVGDSLFLGLVLFVVNVTLLSFVIAWFRVKTDGVLASTLVHTFHNLAYIWIGGAFNLAEKDLLVVGESGYIVTIAFVIIILIFQAWKEPKKA